MFCIGCWTAFCLVVFGSEVHPGPISYGQGVIGKSMCGMKHGTCVFPSAETIWWNGRLWRSTLGVPVDIGTLLEVGKEREKGKHSCEGHQISPTHSVETGLVQ